MASTLQLLKTLAEANVKFVLIGGLAAVVHGSPRNTEDTDICAPLDDENIGRLERALRHHRPRFRFHPNRPPLPSDPLALHGFKNLNLTTDLGIIDVLTEVTGIGGYVEASRHSVTLDVEGFSIQVLDIDTLIIAKKAAGRLKDQLAIPELEAVRDRLRAKGEL